MNIPDFPLMDLQLRKVLINPGSFDLEREIVIDTDTKNEIDDQFALTYALLSDSLNIGAIYAAQFFHKGGPVSEVGLEQSYQEIITILDILTLKKQPPVLRGNRYPLDKSSLEGKGSPPVEKSEAVEDLIRRARATEDYLPVVSIGAATNIGAALLAAPDISSKLLVIWLGGNEYNYAEMTEYNLSGDLIASRLMFHAGLAMIRFPAREVTSRMMLRKQEVSEKVAPLGGIGKFLSDIFMEYVDRKGKDKKEIWDMATVAVFENPGLGKWKILPMPELSQEPQWVWESGGNQGVRPEHCVVTDIDSDAIFSSLFERMRRVYHV